MRRTLTPVLILIPALALGLQAGDRVGVHGGQELRKYIENGYVRAGPRIDVAEFQRNHATADENDGGRQIKVA